MCSRVENVSRLIISLLFVESDHMITKYSLNFILNINNSFNLPDFENTF